MMPGLIKAVVEHPHQFRRAPNHRDISLVINALKKFADVLNCVDVFYGAITACGERFFESLRCANMSRAGRSRQEKNAQLRFHQLRAPASVVCITKLCGDRLQFSQELRAPRFATRRNASDSSEIRGSEFSPLPGQVASAESCRAA